MDYALVKKILLDCFRRDAPVDMRVPVLTVANDNSRSLLLRGKHYSPLMDTLQDDLQRRGVPSLSVARLAASIKGELSHSRVYAPDGGFARALVQKKAASLIRSRAFPYSIWEEQLWGTILDATGALKVVGIQPSRELCAACHDRGVWVADLQHGVIADGHPWYGEKFRGSEDRRYLPDAFLCWDRSSAEVIGSWGHRKGILTPVIGNRWLARFNRADETDTLVKELTAKHADGSDPGEKRLSILVSLSWGETNIPNRFIAEGLLGAMRASADRVRWMIRLHPNQVHGFARDEGDEFQTFFERNVAKYADWAFATNAPLPIVLRKADLHITWASSVCIEAAQMGVKSALLNPVLRNAAAYDRYFGSYQDAGMVDLVDDAEHTVLDWIEQNRDAKRPAPDIAAQDYAYHELLDALCRP